MSIEVDLSIDIAGIKMQNPVITASGTFGFGLDYLHYYDVNKLGAVVVKSITKNKREGNPPPRIIETPAGLLNSIGLANPGIDFFIKEVIPQMDSIRIPVIVSIAGDEIEEYVELASRLDKQDRVAALELNISCPNVKKGGLEFSTSAEQVEKLTVSVRKATSLPIIVKLSPNVTDIVEIAQAAAAGGAHALSLINTVLGMVIDVKMRKPVLGNKKGGLAGPAIRPIAVRMVWDVSQAVDIPVIGMGGICTAEDALQFIMAGASAVAVGTWNFVNPTAPLDIIDGLKEFCIKEGVKDIKELIGCSWK
ncbi:MAG TPA: dihydroorotate dehydrogenase [Peptococcaceae bacterium]|nr:MAG: Dihydroorotate dehydrogenase [Clostridia bacterium 41_269]HBT19907.1 dihydroorotate dehydrogenase [Peptococcaceae bacterium]